MAIEFLPPPVTTPGASTGLVQFEDFGEFTNDGPSLILVDLVDDATDSDQSNDFMNGRGAFVYELDIVIDMLEVVQNEASGLRIEFFRQDPINRQTRDSDRRRGAAANDASAETADFVALQEPAVFSFEIDLGVELATAGFTWLDSGAVTEPEPQMNVVLLDAPPPTQGSETSTPIIAFAGEAQGRSPLELPQFYANAIEGGFDPLNYLAVSHSTYPTLANRFGLDSSGADGDLQEEEPKLVSWDNILVRRSLSEVRKGFEDQPVSPYVTADEVLEQIRLAEIVSNNTDVDSQDSVTLGYAAIVRNYSKRIRRRIDVEKELLGGTEVFFVLMTPILKPGEDQEPGQSRLGLITSFTVNHQNGVMDILLPMVKPGLTLVRNAPGHVVLKMEQRDPAGRKMMLSRSFYSPYNDPPISPSVVVWQTETPPGEEFHLFEDAGVPNIHPNRVTYRLATIGAINRQGPAEGLVISSHEAAVPIRESARGTLAIVTKNEPSRVVIEVENVPNAATIRVMREDLAAPGSTYDRVITLEDINGNTENLADGNDLIFHDYSTAPGRHYRYFAAIRTGLGPEVLTSEDESFVRVQPSKTLPVDVSLGEINAALGPAGWSVSFDIVSTPRNDDMNFVLDLLRDTGVSAEFIQEIERQKSDFAELVVFIVERVSRKTGTRVSFEVQPAGTFVDNPATAGRQGGTPPLSGQRYTYFVKVCLKDPQALLMDVYTQFSSPSQPGIRDRKALAQRFMSAWATQFGNSPGGALPATSDLIKGVPVQDNLRAGYTGIELATSLTLPGALAQPTSLVGRRMSSVTHHMVLLQWQVGGDLSTVDQCVVFVEYAGGRAVVGAVPANGTQSMFWYHDLRFGRSPGTLKYSVRLIYTDMTLSAESPAFIIRNVSYTPEPMLRGTYLGTSRRTYSGPNPTRERRPGADLQDRRARRLEDL